MRQGVVFSIVVLIAFYTPVLAYDWSTNPGDGNEANPYQISTPEQLMSIGSDEVLLTKHYILTNDIVFDPINNPEHVFNDALIAPVSPSDIFEGVVKRNKQFSGTFDGNGYAIKNFKIENLNKEYLGLFSNIRDMGKIVNLHIINADIKGANRIACLVAYNNEATISNCSATAIINSRGDLGGIGGLVGINSGVVSHCSFTGDVTGPNVWSAIGGLVGANRGTILNSFSDGSFGGGDCIGGLVGWNYNGIILGCYSTGSISGHMETAGLVSRNENGTIENCYSMCSVDGWEDSAGLVAYNKYGSILNCYSTGSVNGRSPLGGLVGYNRDGVVEHSFWDINTSGCYSSNGGTGLTTWDMNRKQIFLDAGWDFINIWWMDESDWNAPENYPILKWQLPPTPPVADAGIDQEIFIFGNSFADVYLNGTSSYDKYDDPLEYYWYDANELIATGAEPNVVLGFGEHEITLVVNDGTEDSEPDSCIVTVIEPVETTAKVLPGTINTESNREQIVGRLVFVGESEPVLDPNEPMLLLTGDAEIEAAEQKLVYSKKEIAWYLVGSFDSAAVVEAINSNSHGQAELDRATLEVTLMARFEAGQWVYGRDMVKVK